MRAALSMKMSCIGINDEAPCDPFGAFEQRQRVGENVISIFSREQGETDGCGECRFEIERESRRDRSVEDVARRGLKAVAVENAGFWIERRSIQHWQDPASATWLVPIGRSAARHPKRLSTGLARFGLQSGTGLFSAVARDPGRDVRPALAHRS